MERDGTRRPQEILSPQSHDAPRLPSDRAYDGKLMNVSRQDPASASTSARSGRRAAVGVRRKDTSGPRPDRRKPRSCDLAQSRLTRLLARCLPFDCQLKSGARDDKMARLAWLDFTTVPAVCVTSSYELLFIRVAFRHLDAFWTTPRSQTERVHSYKPH